MIGGSLLTITAFGCCLFAPGSLDCYCEQQPGLPECQADSPGVVRFQVKFHNGCNNTYSTARGVPWQIEYLATSGETIKLDLPAVAVGGDATSTVLLGMDNDKNGWLDDLTLHFDRSDVYEGYDYDYREFEDEWRIEDGATLHLTMNQNNCLILFSNVEYLDEPIANRALAGIRNFVVDDNANTSQEPLAPVPDPAFP